MNSNFHILSFSFQQHSICNILMIPSRLVIEFNLCMFAVIECSFFWVAVLQRKVCAYICFICSFFLFFYTSHLFTYFSPASVLLLLFISSPLPCNILFSTYHSFLLLAVQHVDGYWLLIQTNWQTLRRTDLSQLIQALIFYSTSRQSVWQIRWSSRGYQVSVVNEKHMCAWRCTTSRRR